MTEIVCKETFSRSFYERKKSWLHKHSSRRLFFIDKPARINDPQVRFFPLETELHRELVAKQIGELSVLKPIEVLDDVWKESIARHHLAAQTTMSDAADFGVPLLRNLHRPMRSLLALENILHGIPAVVVGAGPSLENVSLNGGFLIAAGTALECMPVKPHLAVAIDGHTPLPRTKYLDVPMCVQMRVHPETLRGRPLLYLPDSHHLFEPWLMGQHSCFSGGWTVGNTAVAIAAHLGCNPITLVGMDYCYRGKQKYAGRKNGATANLVQTQNARGETVFTQSDWLMAVQWLNEFSTQHPEITFYHVEDHGLRIGGRVQPLKQLPRGRPVDPFPWQKAPAVTLDKHRLSEWKQSLRDKTSLAHELLFEPLWRSWGPFFERELMVDKMPLLLEQKMALQKTLFCERVAEEHLHALGTD